MRGQFIAILGLFVVLAATPVYAQQIEINPYAGGFFPSISDTGGAEFKDEGMYGVRGSISVLENIFALEGNFGYINHFEFDGTDPESNAILWDVNGLYHFFPGRTTLVPFVTFGVGGLTALVDSEFDPAHFLVSDGEATLLDGPPAAPPATGNVFRLGDTDTFFGFNYGGGVKANRLWGPLGLRADVRGRTLPNVFGESLTWIETVGGITLTWGER